MLRVLHGPVNVGNHPWVLSRHERALGLHSDLVIRKGNRLNYPADTILRGSDSGTLGIVREACFGLASPFRYDVLHYYFGQSFLGSFTGPRRWGKFLDLRLARRLDKPVFMTLQGCDARISGRNSQRDQQSACRLGHCAQAAGCRERIDRQRLQFVKEILPHCSRVLVLNPDLVHDIPSAQFLPYANVDVDHVEPTWPSTKGPITLLHAPTDESIKGTKYIVAAVEQLARRWPVRLELVRGLPHAEAMRRYQQADLVIDQVLAGWYGGFAVEAMALGKPVAGYLRESDLSFVPQAMRDELPIARVRLESLEADLEALLQQRERWPEWGRMSRKYVVRWHHPRRIAAALARLYHDPTAALDFTWEASDVARSPSATVQSHKATRIVPPTEKNHAA